AGSCSASFTLEARDSLGTATSTPSPVSVALGSSSVTTTFYSNNTCTSAITSQTLNAGATQTTFYVKDSSLGSATVSAVAPGLASATQGMNLTAPTRVFIDTRAVAAAPGSCNNIDFYVEDDH